MKADIWRKTLGVIIILCVVFIATYEIVWPFVSSNVFPSTIATYQVLQESENVSYPDEQQIVEQSLHKVLGADTSRTNMSICDQKQRLARLKETCQEIGDRVPKEFAGLKVQPAIVDRNHRILLGWVSKGGSTALKALLLDASGFNVTEELHSHSLPGLARKLRKYNVSSLNYINDNEMPEILNNYTRILVVRNPFERLLSTYHGKVVSDESKLLYMRKKIWEMQNRTMSKQKAPAKLPVPSFSQFLQWIAHSKSTNVHWNPIFVEADACSIEWDYVLRLETMQHDSQYLLDKLKKDLPYDKMPVRHSHKDGPTMDHSRMVLPEYKNVPRSAIDYFLNLYRFDLMMFGYQWDQSTTTSSCSIRQKADTGYGCC